MSLRMIEGFDHCGGSVAGIVQAGWNYSGTFQSGSALNSPGRWGVGRYLYTVGQNNYVSKVIPGGFPEVWYGFALAGNIRTGIGWVQLVNQSLGACAQFGRNAGGYVELRNGASTVVATSTYLWDGGWHYVEIRVLANGAAGTAEVWIDGAQVIPSTVGNYGVAAAATQPAGALFYNYDAGGGTWWTTYLDDFYMLDTATGVKTTRLGECRVETLYPNADGSHLDFTPTTAGTHFDEVDDGAAGHDTDATTVMSNVVGARDSFNVQDLSIASGTIHGVAVKTNARKNDAGPRTIKHSIRQGGVTYDGALAHTLIAGHSCQQTCWDQDPVSGAWTVANVNGDEYGVKVEA